MESGDIWRSWGTGDVVQGDLCASWTEPGVGSAPEQSSRNMGLFGLDPCP